MNCDLCRFLSNTNLDAIKLIIWLSQYNPVFTVHGRQEDAEEFLMILIDKCANLSNLTHFDTNERHTCTVCGKVSYVSEEITDISNNATLKLSLPNLLTRYVLVKV